jgi:hypothetical protein
MAVRQCGIVLLMRLIAGDPKSPIGRSMEQVDAAEA